MYKLIGNPENVGGSCMTGRIMNDTEGKKVSSYIAQYKEKKKAYSPSKKAKS
jgi:hypothetical protein